MLAKSGTNDLCFSLITLRSRLRPWLRFQAVLASGTVLQMDQAATAVHRHVGQCRKESDMGRPVHLPAGGDHEKEAVHSVFAHTFLQILEVNLLEKKPISSLVAEALKQNHDATDCN